MSLRASIAIPSSTYLTAAEARIESPHQCILSRLFPRGFSYPLYHPITAKYPLNAFGTRRTAMPWHRLTATWKQAQGKEQKRWINVSQLRINSERVHIKAAGIRTLVDAYIGHGFDEKDAFLVSLRRMKLSQTFHAIPNSGGRSTPTPLTIHGSCSARPDGSLHASLIQRRMKDIRAVFVRQ